MSDYLLPLAVSPGFDEANEQMVAVRDQVVNEDGSPRYKEGLVYRGDNSVTVENMSIQELAAVARFCGVKTSEGGAHSLIKDIPQFVMIKSRYKEGKVQLLHTATGKKFKET